MTYPNLAGIIYESIVDGTGVRTAIFLSGCIHKCYECHNLEAQNPTYGLPVTEGVIELLAKEIVKRPYLAGITLTGGDPMFWPENTLNFMMTLEKKIKELNPDWFKERTEPVWCYTGYVYEQLPKTPEIEAILSKTSVLVDGLFVKALADKRLAFRGSSNQRIIYLHKEGKE